MVTDTSIKAYMEFKERYEYGVKLIDVYKAIHKIPMLTSREYTQLVLQKQDMNSVRPRISDLANAGFIEKAGKRKCVISKRLCYVWRVKW